MIKCVILLSTLLALCWSHPMEYQQELVEDMDFAHEQYYEGERIRRSPQDRGSIQVSGSMQERGGGSARADANYNLWRSQNGRSSFDANAHYQRNWGSPGPRQNYGGGVTFTHRF